MKLDVDSTKVALPFVRSRPLLPVIYNLAQQALCRNDLAEETGKCGSGVRPRACRCQNVPSHPSRQRLQVASYARWRSGATGPPSAD
jgi:hypothetical protein